MERPLLAARAAAERHLQPRGSSQGGLRQYNERVVLQAIRLALFQYMMIRAVSVPIMLRARAS